MASKEQSAFALWLTGLPASGKSTITAHLVEQLREIGVNITVLESDVLRKLFSSQPRYDEQDREYFYGAIAFIGRVLTAHGIPVIFDATANLRAYRNRARQEITRFVEVFVDAPLEVCMRRDPKAIYRKARDGEATQVPGLQAVYEPPEHPEIVIDADREDPGEAAQRIVAFLRSKQFV